MSGTLEEDCASVGAKLYLQYNIQYYISLLIACHILYNTHTQELAEDRAGGQLGNKLDDNVISL